MSYYVDDAFDYLDTPRFNETRLVGYTVAELTSLINDSGPGLRINAKAEKLWETLVNKEPLNTAEREVINGVIQSLREGTSAMGLSYEEMGSSKGTKIEYSADAITLTPKSGAPVVVPNFPVPPPPRIETRPSQEWLDPWVIANFDISGGVVSEIRQRRDLDSAWTGLYSTLTITGLDGMKPLVTRILASSPQWPAIQKEKRSCQGWPFFDMWVIACATCPFSYYLALHDVIITKVLKHAIFVPTKETKDLPAPQQKLELRSTKAHTPSGLIPAYGQDVLVPLKKTDLVSDEEEQAVRHFIGKTRHIPYLIAGPVKTMINFYTEQSADPVNAVMAYYRLQKFFGGKKRGLGRIAASWNFGPRMSKVWREVNTLSMISDGVEGPHQIRVSSGAFPIMLARCKARKSLDVTLLINDSQEQLRYSLPVSDQQYVTSKRDVRKVFVGFQDKCVLPEFDPKTPADSKTKIDLAYSSWVSTLPEGPFSIYTKVFSDQAFSDYSVTPMNSCFDLSAVVTNLTSASDTVDSQQFFKMAIKGIRAMATWWHSPERTFPILAGYYTPHVDTMSWSAEEGFTMNPEFAFGEDYHDDYDGDEFEGEEWDEVVDTVSTTTTTTTTGMPVVAAVSKATAVVPAPTSSSVLVTSTVPTPSVVSPEKQEGRLVETGKQRADRLAAEKSEVGEEKKIVRKQRVPRTEKIKSEESIEEEQVMDTYPGQEWTM